MFRRNAGDLSSLVETAPEPGEDGQVPDRVSTDVAEAPERAHPAPLADDHGLLLGPAPDTGPHRVRRAGAAVRRGLDLTSRALAQRPVLLGAVSATVSAVAMGWNLFGYPKFDDAEGSTTFQAWSLLRGTGPQTLSSFGHVPGGPILLAGWTRLLELTGSGFGALAGLTTIERGRVFAVVLAALATLLLFLVIRRLTGYDLLATGGALLFALSPLEIWYARALHPETFGAFWLVVALALAIPSVRGRWAVPRALACGLALGVAVTSMELAIVAAPGLALMIAGWPRRHRGFALAAAAAGSVVAPLALVAWLAANGALGATAGHPSFVGMLAASAAQQHDAGVLNSSSHFWDVKNTWTTLQPFLVILTGLAPVWLVAFGRGLIRRGVGLVALAFWAMFASGLDVQASFVVLALPSWIVASIVAGMDIAERRAIQSRLWGFGVFARPAGVATVIGLLLIPPAIPADALAVAAQDGSVQSNLTVWLRIHVPDGGAVVDNGSDTLDLRGSDLDGRNLPVTCTYYDYSCLHAPGVTVAYIVDTSELNYLSDRNSYRDAALRRFALTGELAWSASGLSDGDYIHVFRVPMPQPTPGGGSSAP